LSNGVMHLEVSQTAAENHDEPSSICFSDLYNLYEIIGKYEEIIGKSQKFCYFASSEDHLASFDVVRIKQAINNMQWKSSMSNNLHPRPAFLPTVNRFELEILQLFFFVF